MDKFCVISNRAKDLNLQTTDVIIKYLQQQNRSCFALERSDKKDSAYHYTDPNMIPADTQCIIVLGGDGTLLQAARDTVGLGIPLIGINKGHLGYLAEAAEDEIYHVLNGLMADDYVIEERMMIRGQVLRDGEVIGSDLALNDIVIGKDGAPKVLNFKNFVNGKYLNSYDADGIIISTPTGSTGYSLSCGGPLVSPSAFLTLMTPIAPHTLNTRSIIFPDDDVITVELGTRKAEKDSGLISFDGDTVIPIESGDSIMIEKAEQVTRIAKLSHLSFVEILRRKMKNT